MERILSPSALCARQYNKGAEQAGGCQKVAEVGQVLEIDEDTYMSLRESIMEAFAIH